MKKMQCHIISNSRWCPSSTAPSLLAKQPGHSPDNLPPVLSEWSPNHIGLHRVLSYSVITHAVGFGMLCTYRVMYRAVCWGGGGGGGRVVAAQGTLHQSATTHTLHCQRYVFLANCLLTPAGDGMHSGLKLVYVCMLVQQHLLHRIP